MSHTILSRRAVGELSSLGLKPIQTQVDQLVEGFVRQATDPVTLAAITGGGFASRFTRVGLMSSAAGAGGTLPWRAVSLLFGFGAEVGSFEGIQRLLSGEENPHRWSWSGASGWREGLARSAVTFGLLKGAGFLARNQNIALQHLFQSSALVAGQHALFGLGMTPRPEGGLAQQLIQAEATNLQMSAGMALFHGMFPGMIALERSLDLSLKAREGIPVFGGQNYFLGSFSSRWEMAGVGVSPASRERGDANPLMMMAGHGKGEVGASKPPEKEFWYPCRHSRKVPLDIGYAGEAERQITQLEDQMRKALKEVEGISSREELFKIRPDEDLVNSVWWHQLRAFARALGVEPKEFTDPEELLIALKADLPAQHPEVSREAVKLLKEEGLGTDAFRVVELEIPHPDVFFGDPKRPKESTGLIYIQESIEGELRNTVRLGETDKERGTLKVRFMSLSLMERLLQGVHGPEAPLLFYVEGEIPQPLSMKLKVLGASPIGISRGSLRLGDLRVRVHPWFFTLHDLFHASMITKFPRSLRSLIGQVYFLAKSDSRLRKSPFLKEHLDRLSDMDPPIDEQGRPASFFSHTLGHLHHRYREDKENDRLTMGRILQYHYFLNRYSELLRDYTPADPKWESWRRDFSEEIEKLLGNFNRMIHRIGRAYADFLKQK